MGHKAIAMTCRYAHLAPSYKLAAVERLAASNRPGTASDTRTDTEPGNPEIVVHTKAH